MSIDYPNKEVTDRSLEFMRELNVMPQYEFGWILGGMMHRVTTSKSDLSPRDTGGLVVRNASITRKIYNAALHPTENRIAIFVG